MKEAQPSAPDYQRLLDSLGKLPEPVAKPSFIVVAGLPGTGKTYVAEKLAGKTPLVRLESDALRKTMFPRPTYSPDESTRLFQVIHQIIEYLLKRGISLVLDATNLTESKREQLYQIAENLGVKLVLVWVEAPPEVVKQRLADRLRQPDNKSDADWEIYEQMKPAVEVIKRNHYVINTTGDINPTINKIIREAIAK